MIETLYGRIFEIDALACTAIIECAGVGYKVAVTANTLSQLPAPEYEPDGTQIAGKCTSYLYIFHYRYGYPAIEGYSLGRVEQRK